MIEGRRKDRLSAPLMHAFRSAHAARDARTKADVRTADGEGVFAGRRTLGRSPVTDTVLRREVAIVDGFISASRLMAVAPRANRWRQFPHTADIRSWC